MMGRSSRNPHRRVFRPSIDPLEDRTLPAATLTAGLANGVLTIEGTNGPDHIALWGVVNRIMVPGTTINTASGPTSSVAATDVKRIVVNALGGDDTILLNQDIYGFSRTTQPAFLDGGAGNDSIVGGWGDDTLSGNSGDDTLSGGAGNDLIYGGDGNNVIYGNEGNDTLCGGTGGNTIYGGAGNDMLFGDTGKNVFYGEDGNDTLVGGPANDTLLGGAGFDVLRGGAGNDYLDAGSRGENVDGGDGWDLDVWQWDTGGPQVTDVAQRNAPTCSFLAALGAVAWTDPASLDQGITYLGNNSYSVRLFRANAVGGGQWVTQQVTFDGSWTANDPQPVGEGKFWVVLYQRAWQQERAAEGKPDSAWPDEAFIALTGTSSYGYYASAKDLFYQVVAGGYRIVASTLDSSAISPKLVANHAYTVLGVDASGNVVLRNPWGIDGGAQASDAPGDGIITLSWAEFQASMFAFWVS